MFDRIVVLKSNPTEVVHDKYCRVLSCSNCHGSPLFVLIPKTVKAAAAGLDQIMCPYCGCVGVLTP